jgi:secreted trypsin-like serine protease
LGAGPGGTCSGDSGGPILWRGTDIVVAINSFGIAPYCHGNDYAFRTDTEVARAFLSQFIALP